jgi:hypothetical protein
MSVKSTAFKLNRTGTKVDMVVNPRINLETSIPTRSAGNDTIDCSLASTFYKTGGTATIDLNTIGEGQYITLVLSSTGSAYTVTWASDSGTIRWASSAVPVPTVTASKHDLYSFLRIGSNIFATAALNMG